MKIKSLLLTAVLATTILCSAGFTNAQTTDNSTLIAQLQAQIAQLTAQLQTLMGQQGTTAWCHNFNNYLVAGTANGDVASLQTALTKQGFDVSGDSQGTFGDNTASAVVQFQGKNGIRQTGTVGPITRAKLNSLYGCGGGTPTPTPSPTPTPTPNPIPMPNPNPSPTACTPKWTCIWGPCLNNSKSQVVTDASGCLAPAGQQLITPKFTCPTTTQACISPSISLTSPNGGEQLVQGQTHNITWTSAGEFPTGAQVLGYVMDTTGVPTYMKGVGKNTPIFSVLPVGQGSYAWTVPTSLTPGTSFKVNICLNGFPAIVCGMSANYFSIVAPQ
jgi:peptidoglycan hydrolase-like protein with peptidoglycan-binding domain